MSTYFIRLIPLDMSFVPDDEAQRAAVELAASFGFPDGSCTTYDDVGFIDGGENFPHRLPCQHCGYDLLTDRHWTEVMMDNAYRSVPQFSDLESLCPLCEAVLSLHDLSLREPSYGFARWVLQVPGTGQVVLASQIAALSSTIGTPVRAIYVHL